VRIRRVAAIPDVRHVKAIAFHRALQERIAGLPGVTSVGSTRRYQRGSARVLRCMARRSSSPPASSHLRIHTDRRAGFLRNASHPGAVARQRGPTSMAERRRWSSRRRWPIGCGPVKTRLARINSNGSVDDMVSRRRRRARLRGEASTAQPAKRCSTH
jgi:hypothetical protein